MLATAQSLNKATAGLRSYQLDSVEAVQRGLRELDGGLVVSMPTGSGKSHVIAALAQLEIERGGRVVVLAHRKELLEQNAAKIRQADPALDVGIVSTGLGHWEVNSACVVAGIQTAIQRVDAIGSRTLVLIDEVHRCPFQGEGQYRSFLSRIARIEPSVRLVGLPATLYRLDGGALCRPDGLFRHLVHTVEMLELIDAGYLCRPVSRGGRSQSDTRGLARQGGDFVARDAEQLMCPDDVVEAACEEIVERTVERKAVLIFTAGVTHCRKVNDALRRRGCDAWFVTGETPAAERAAAIEAFRQGELKYLANVNVLSEGFDHPAVDCVVGLRPTCSAGLFLQQVGRGMRPHPSKSDFLVLDFAGNFERFGPIDEIEAPTGAGRQAADNGSRRKPIEPWKICVCGAVNPRGSTDCGECSNSFLKKAKHRARPDVAIAMSDEGDTETNTVIAVEYAVHAKQFAPPNHPKTLKVRYWVGSADWHDEYVCFEHQGKPREIAVNWWRKRHGGFAIPGTAAEAFSHAVVGELREPATTTTRLIPGERWPRIVRFGWEEAE